MKHYTYLHFFMHRNAVFATPLCRLINLPENRFDVGEHAFITTYRNVYDALRDYENVFYYEDASHGADVINHYGDAGDVLIVHSMPPVMKALKIKRKFRKKIIWRTWGHDIGFRTDASLSVKNFSKKALNYLWRREVRSFIGIGVANVVDVINLQKHFGDVKTFGMAYPHGNYKDRCEQLKAEAIPSDGCANILVGHSAHPADNHIAILEKLTPCLQEGKAKCFLVLSYGEDAYRDRVVSYVEEHQLPNVEIIRDFMERDDYIRFLNRMDAAVFDSKGSYALGNITILLRLGKKIYLNENGILAEAFRKEHVPYGRTDTLREDVDSLTSPVDYSECRGSSLFGLPYEERIRQWHEALSSALPDRKS